MKYKILSTNNTIEADLAFVTAVHPNDFIEIIEVVLFSTLKAEKLQELKDWHDSKIDGMKAKYSQAEMDSFLDKRNEAMAWRVLNTTATPYIDAMSNGDVAMRLMLLNAILGKVDATAQLEALILSKRDLVEATTTPSGLLTISW